jgi:hypothetical protein
MTGYQEREAMKTEASRIVHDPSASEMQRAAALLRWSEAHYWRAREHLDTAPLSFLRAVLVRMVPRGYELEIDTYTRHWLAAVAPSIHGAVDLIDVIGEQWGYRPERCAYLPPGRSIYVDPETLPASARWPKPDMRPPRKGKAARLLRRGDVIRLKVRTMGGFKGVGIVTEDMTHPGGVVLFVRMGMDLRETPGAVAAASEAIEELRKITGMDPGLIVVDTLARNFGANENDSEAMSVFIAHLDEIRAPFKATALVVHHSGKDEARGPRGSTVLFGAIDASYVVTRDELGMVSLTPEAMKDSALPPVQVFGMTPVALPIESQDGREVSSCVLSLFGADYKPPQRGKAGRGKNQTRALMHLNRLYEQHQERVERSGRDPDEARVLVADWRAACLDDGVGANRWPETLASLKSADLVSVEGIYARPLQ